MSVCVTVEPETGRSSCPVEFSFNISINIMDMTTGLPISMSFCFKQSSRSVQFHLQAM